MSELTKFLSAQSDLDLSMPLLPLIHSCECFDARRILSSKQLEVRMCKVFHEELLYFYYGKPSYPVGEKCKGYRTDYEYAPVCFILDMQKVSIHKIYPFDSGAFFNDLYGGFFHRDMVITEFELDSSANGIKSYVSYMFGNNESYYEGTALQNDNTGNPYVDGLIKMTTANGTLNFDERSRTIEIISKNNVPLIDTVKCIILPRNLLVDDTIRAFLMDNNIEYRTYKVRQLTHPASYYGVIVDKANDYISEKGGLK